MNVLVSCKKFIKFYKIPKWVSMDTKHVFLHVYFLQMWPTSKAMHFEPIEHIFLIKWFEKWVFCLVA
jgi:hypothetical protein